MQSPYRTILLGVTSAIGSVVIAAIAHAQNSGTFIDTPVITSYYQSNAAGFNARGTPVSGSISPATTMDGLHYLAFCDAPNPGKGGGGYARTILEIYGFSSNPGQNWLTSASVNGATFKGSAATFYNFSPSLYGRTNVATWSWPSSVAGPGFLGKPSPSTATIIHTGTSAWVRPKYRVVGLTYAPPGSKSTANYSSGFQSGTSTSETKTFKVGTSVSDKVSVGFTLFGVLNGDSTQTYSASWLDQQDDDSSVSLSQTSSTGLIVPGPASSGLGVDHDFDVVYIWLNPDIFVELPPNGVVIGGYGYDARDTVTGVDVIPLTIGELKGTQAVPSDARARLNRTWDPNLGALTAADFQAIAQVDPFVSNPGFNPNLDSRHRYELPLSGSPPTPTDLIFDYTPVPQGVQPTCRDYMSGYKATSMTGQTTTETFSVSYSIDGTASAAWFAKWNTTLSSTTTLTYMNKWSKSITQGTSQDANFTICPPLASDNYRGPTAIQVWKDNIYGTFMFYPEN